MEEITAQAIDEKPKCEEMPRRSVRISSQSNNQPTLARKYCLTEPDECVEELGDSDVDRLCRKCGSLFTTPAMLARHQKEVHEKKKPHVCFECGQEFARIEHVKRHLNGFHYKKSVDCPYCDAKLSERYKLKLHIRRYHPKKSEPSLLKKRGPKVLLVKYPHDVEKLLSEPIYHESMKMGEDKAVSHNTEPQTPPEFHETSIEEPSALFKSQNPSGLITPTEKKPETFFSEEGSSRQLVNSPAVSSPQPQSSPKNCCRPSLNVNFPVQIQNHQVPCQLNQMPPGHQLISQRPGNGFAPWHYFVPPRIQPPPHPIQPVYPPLHYLPFPNQQQLIWPQLPRNGCFPQQMAIPNNFHGFQNSFLGFQGR